MRLHKVLGGESRLVQVPGSSAAGGVQVYVDGLLMPIAPRQILTRYRGRNQRTALLDGGEATHLRTGSGAEVSIELCLPRRVLPFARYGARGFQAPEIFLERFLDLRQMRRPFRFITAQILPGRGILADTNLRVSLEDFEVKESAEEGGDLIVQMTMREYQAYAATRVAVEDQSIVFEWPVRETDNRPQHTTHTVVRGDTLWGIARRFLGDGRRYREIFDLNRDQISNPNLIFPGQVLQLPAA
ncbi:MAG: LysM peptidoglycan-binding domain-containing protein [Oscillospiraceae bacterium]|nr:LysM peptidoglycan-binding domain-containing protein [Oscillospiraceae bacterium]